MKYTIENITAEKICIATETEEESLKVHYIMHMNGVQWCLAGGHVMEFPRYVNGSDTLVGLTREGRLANYTKENMLRGISGEDHWYRGWQIISAQQFIDDNKGDIDLENIPEFNYDNASSEEYKHL